MEVRVEGAQNPLEYNPSELLICTAARLMTDFTTAIIGTGIPMLAAALAQRMHAPNLVAIFEFGGIGPVLDQLPLAVGGERSFHRAVAALGLCETVETAQRGLVEYGFLGGRADRSIRQPEQHHNRRLPASESTAARKRRRERFRLTLLAHHCHHAAR